MKHFILFFLFFITISQSEIRFLCTAALISHKYEERKKEYIIALCSLHDYGYIPYIVESCYLGSAPTFLDACSPFVLYTQTNNPALKNKGINEAISLLKGLEQFQFADDDMVIKLTGRYYFNSDEFIRIVESSDADVIVKFDPYGQVCGPCYVMRCHYFKEMLRQMNYLEMERKMINIEYEIAKFVKQKHELKIKVVDYLGVRGTVFGNGMIENETYNG